MLDDVRNAIYGHCSPYGCTFIIKTREKRIILIKNVVLQPSENHS